jgi:hypothetical protein
MKELEELDFENPADSGFTKKELLLKKRELDKLHKSLGGIRNLQKTPSAIWVVDAKREHLAIDEAKKLGIPVIGILDTNADPDEFQFPIPGNDDAIRSVGLLTRIIADAAAEGSSSATTRPTRPPTPSRSPTGSASCSRLAAAEVVTDVAEVETIATESAADEAGAEAKAEGDAAASPPSNTPARAVATRVAPAPASTHHDQGATTHGKLHHRRHQDAARAARHGHGRHQEGARGGRRRPREGRRDPAPEGREGQRKRRPLHSEGVKHGDKVTILELNTETVAKNERFIALADKVLEAAAAVDADSVEAALAAPPVRRRSPSSSRRGRDHRREGRAAPRAHALGRQVRDLPAQDEQGPAAAGRRGPRLHGRRRRDGALDRAAHLVRQPDLPLARGRPAAEVEKEREIVTEISRNEGKPEAALPKIVEGRVNAFFKQVALLDQDYAKDNKLSVAKVAGDAGITITDFARFKVGA